MRKETCDILIVGGGAAGLIAAAASSGLDTLIVEKSDVVGGTTALSGGTLWIPANPVSRALGVKDNKRLGKQYLDTALGPSGEEHVGAFPGRRDTFLTKGPEMVSFLQNQGFKWSKRVSTFPDYYPKLQGVLPSGGRTLDPALFDVGSLGEWCSYLAPSEGSLLVFRFQDLRVLTRPYASLRDFLEVCWMALKAKFYDLYCRSPVSMGGSLVAQLLNICRKHGNVRVYKETSLVKLVTENGVVTGGVLRQGGSDIEVRAKRGVLLTTAGFARSQKLRDNHIGKPTNTQWSLTRRGGDTGTALQVGKSLGVVTACLNKLWGIPIMKDPITGATTSALFELSKPHSIVVNQLGVRYFCESQPYGDIVDSMFKRGRKTPRTWLILDQNYRKKYTIGSLNPRKDSKNAIDSYRLFKADGLTELARQIGVSPETLEHTIERWNLMCETGRDLDFNRGSDEYQRFIGDPNVRPNSNMGPIHNGPFYAIEIYLGDAGTRGGLLTDRYARVLRTDGSAIEGLYAAGNSAASIMTGTAPGAGATLGPAMTFAYIAANHMKSGAD